MVPGRPAESTDYCLLSSACTDSSVSTVYRRSTESDWTTDGTREAGGARRERSGEVLEAKFILYRSRYTVRDPHETQPHTVVDRYTRRPVSLTPLLAARD